jgi:hypothetical protein
MVGHVDNAQGPAVFYGLGALKQGNKVEVLRKDGKLAVFEVYGIEVYDSTISPANASTAPRERPNCGSSPAAAAIPRRTVTRGTWSSSPA